MSREEIEELVKANPQPPLTEELLKEYLLEIFFKVKEEPKPATKIDNEFTQLLDRNLVYHGRGANNGE